MTQKQVKKDKDQKGKTYKTGPVKRQNIILAILNVILAFIFFLKLDPTKWVLVFLGILFAGLAVYELVKMAKAPKEKKFSRTYLGLIFLFVGLAVFFFTQTPDVISVLVTRAKIVPFFLGLVLFFEAGMNLQYAIIRYNLQSLDWWVNLIFTIGYFVFGLLVIHFGGGNDLLLGILFLALAVTCIYTAIMVNWKPATDDEIKMAKAQVQKEKNPFKTNSGRDRYLDDEDKTQPIDLSEEDVYAADGVKHFAEEEEKDEDLGEGEEEDDSRVNPHPDQVYTDEDGVTYYPEDKEQDLDFNGDDLDFGGDD